MTDSYRRNRSVTGARLLLVVSVFAVFSVGVTAQRSGAVASLKGVAVPQPPDLARYVSDPQALIVLGKALFWDVQVGSDGRTACATCHFHAGADHRVTNQIAGPPTSTTPVRPNQVVTTHDFPFHAFANLIDNRSAVIRDRRDVVGSAGLVKRTFVDVVSGSASDLGRDDDPGLFSLGGVKARQVTSRNAPTVINAVFYVRNFWDGRAHNIFNAGSPFGPADERTTVLALRDGSLTPEAIRLDASSLASQAVGPPLNALEMSFEGRSWGDVGRKLLSLRPLARQNVASDDSVFASTANASGTGLTSNVTYASLIRDAFQSAYWSSPAVLDTSGRVVSASGEPGPRELSQLTYNFGLFFGLAVQAYEATLISDDSPADRFLAGDNSALTAFQQLGLNDFRAAGTKCTECHQGPEFSAAGITTARADAVDPRELGFFRTAVSAIADDPGAAGTDALGAPLFPGAPDDHARGAFKSPGLRNVELTGPYFHTGGSATLDQVMEFYARNGDVPDGGNLGPGMGSINLSQQEAIRIIDFLLALTDERVRFERAPFDHPSLCVPIGHLESAPGILTPDTSAPGLSAGATDIGALVPAVGRNGNTAPLQTFAELLLGVGRDGSRAHTLQEPCAP